MTKTSTKTIDVGALDDDALTELSRETRRRQDDASRTVSRRQAAERLEAMRAEVQDRARRALDELLHRIGTRAAPDPPDAEMVCAIESAHGRPYLDVLADEVAVSGAFVDGGDDPGELRELDRAIDVEARRRALEREAEAVKEGSVRV